MAISNNLNFTKRQLKAFACLFRQARLASGLTQLQVADQAFGYKVSHCKVSRVERAAMPKVDAHCLEAMASVLSIPSNALLKVDPRFKARAVIARAATRRGFWNPAARSVVAQRCVV